MPQKATDAAGARDWQHIRSTWIKTLEKKTGKSLPDWTKRVAAAKPSGKGALKDWLEQQGVTGYAAQVLIMEQFGYPDFMDTSGTDLIDAQYADRPQLRPVYDRIAAAAQEFGPIVIQARKGYVSLLAPRRTFARIQATTKTRLDLGLRLSGRQPGGRLLPGKIHTTMPVQLALSSIGEFDEEALQLLRAAYDE
ncbi:MAG: hypothetical protein J2P49_00075, partial [Methylocapsa sp.]|nr:hypothetical protein [Methylocapsa sp.]